MNRASHRIRLVVVSTTVLFYGCRPEAPPTFSAGQEVELLTEDLEDEEEIALFEDLQQQIGEILQQRTGTPERLIQLGDELHEPLRRGYAVYSRYCTQCHGVNGDGAGPVAEQLDPKPRNYTLGVFKFTSTPYGAKPRRSDLVRTVRRGVTGTSMPSFDRLSDDDVEAVVDYVLALAYRAELERQLAMVAYDEAEFPEGEELDDLVDYLVADVLAPWQEASNQIVMPATPMPPMTDETILDGHRIFLKQACNKCHGTTGRGGSMDGVEVGVDAWGNKAAAADLSSGMFRGGRRPIDIYRRIYSGINGTPMPAFAGTFQSDPDAIWHIVHFIKATGERRRKGLPPLEANDVPSDLTSPAIDADSAIPQDEEIIQRDGGERDSSTIDTDGVEGSTSDATNDSSNANAE